MRLPCERGEGFYLFKKHYLYGLKLDAYESKKSQS
jgi:hypothetical protein